MNTSWLQSTEFNLHKHKLHFRTCTLLQHLSAPLLWPIGTLGFNGHTGCPITHVIILHLLVDSHQFPSKPILVADLEKHGVILGKNWLAKCNIWLDIKNTCLISLEDWNTASPIKILENSTYNFLHLEGYNQGNGPSRLQKQIERLESLLAKLELHRKKKKKGQNSVARMSQSWGVSVTAVIDSLPSSKRLSNQLVLLQTSPAVDIALISAAPFSCHLWKPGVEIFMTSLYEIECVIENKCSSMEFATEDWSNLLTCYQKFKDVFSKQTSNMLSPQHLCNHNIKLEKNMDPAQAIRHTPLHKQACE